MFQNSVILDNSAFFYSNGVEGGGGGYLFLSFLYDKRCFLYLSQILYNVPM